VYYPITYEGTGWWMEVSLHRNETQMALDREDKARVNSQFKLPLTEHLDNSS